jgi:hypothetical protein
MKEYNIIPLCKTHYCEKILKELNITNYIYVGYGNAFPVTHIDKINNCYIHIAGPSPLKGTKLVINGWKDIVDK